jgi:hypothetical protein
MAVFEGARRNSLLVFVVFPSLLASSCSPQAAKWSAASGMAIAAEVSPLRQMLERVQKASAVGRCEQEAMTWQREVVEALESRCLQIQPIEAGPTRGLAGFQIQQSGPMNLLVRTGAKGEAREVWNRPTYSWKQIHSTFQLIKEKNSVQEWAQLHRSVQHILMDDEDRLLHGTHFEFDHESIPRLLELEKTAEACWKRRACIELRLTPALQSWIRTIPSYLAALKRIEAAPSQDEKREELRDFFQDRIQIDSQRFRFTVQPFVKRVGPSEWAVTVDGSGLDLSAQHSLSQLMTEAWSQPAGKKVSLQWKEVPNPLSIGLFRFVLEPALDGRAFVNHMSRTVHLFPMNTSDAFQHEMGHVLGFKDTYYTVWLPDSCTYREENNSADIMSNHRTGIVLSRHWEELDRAYPWRRSSGPRSTAPTAASSD